MNKKNFFIQIFIFSFCTFVFLGALMLYGESHFIPTKRMKLASDMPDGCFVFLGSSRMGAALDMDVFLEQIKIENNKNCYVNLSFGGVSNSTVAITLREYLKTKKPKGIILGKAGNRVIRDEDPPNPKGLIGSNAVTYLWGKASDVSIYFPGFPLENFDSGIRYLFSQTFSVSTYLSILWLKVQAFQDVLTGKIKGEKNAWGNIEDMKKLNAAYTSKALVRIKKFKTNSGWKMSPWYELLEKLCIDRDIPLTILELPTNSHYRSQVFLSKEGQEYFDWRKNELRKRNWKFLDLSKPQWLKDSDFRDGLHLRTEMGKKFSRELATALGKL